MRMKNIKKATAHIAIVGIALLLTVSSCTEDITLPLDTTYVRLVVEGAITTDTTAHRVMLSRSGDPLNQNPITYISGASVIITDNNDTIKLNENPIGSGKYFTKSNVYGLPGHTYNLTVSNIDINNDGVKETYTAQSFIKKINPIDSLRLLYQVFSPQVKGWLVNLYGWDVGGRNYYATKAYINQHLVTDSTKEYGTTNNAGFDGHYYPGLSVYFLSHSKPDEVLKYGDTIHLELDGITEDYFNFIAGFQQEYQPKSPIFSGPSANVSTNVLPKDKAVGYFAAYSIERKFVILKDTSSMK